MRNFLLEHQQKVEKLTLLTEFITGNPEPRELKRALAVKMALENQPYAQITKLLGIGKSSISYYRQRFEVQGLEGLKLGYQGLKGYLTEPQREEIISWLRTRDYWSFDELVTYIDVNYQVVYASKQSYYTLFSEANISWKKSQKVNPKSDPELVKKNERKFKSSSAKTKLKLNLVS
jgi:putative transposase